MIRNTVILAALFVLATHARMASAQTTPDIDHDVSGLIGDSIKLTASVAIAKPDDVVKTDRLYQAGSILSAPVAFTRTARLDGEVHASTGDKWGWDNDVVIPAGTMIYHATFKRLATASMPLEAWCANQAYTRGVFHDKTSYSMYCIARTVDGKAIGLYGGASQGTMAGSFYYPGTPQWFAFSLSDRHSLPFDYPKISEADLPSPPMILALKLVVENGRASAFWTLTGPAGGDPSYGVISRPLADMHDNHIRVVTASHTISMDYVPQTKSVTHIKVEDGVPTDLSPAGLATYYWMGYELALGGQPSQTVEDAPWQFGAEHVNPATLNVSTGPLAKNDVLLSAAAQLGPRYRLNSPLALWGTNAGAPMGTFVYAASDIHRGVDGTLYRNDYWCLKASFPNTQCVPTTVDQAPGGQERIAWQLSPLSRDIYEGINVTPYRAEYLNVGYRPIDAIADPDPTPVTDTMQIRIADIQTGGVILSLGLIDGDQFHAARAFVLPFDANADATLALWTKRVRLHHEGKTISVTGVEAGSGEGPQLDPDRVMELAK